MDEPLSNLTPNFAIKCGKRYAVFTMNWEPRPSRHHDQIEAMTLADRVAILDRGVLQQHAPPLEAYQQPANEFVQSFLCRHLDDLVDTANTLLRPQADAPRRLESCNERLFSSWLFLLLWRTPLLANDVRADEGRSSTATTLTYNGPGRPSNWSASGTGIHG